MTATVDVRALCHWRQGHANDLTHVAYHFGSVCPYDAIADVLAGRPDPRDQVAEWRVDISLALTGDGKLPLSLNDHRMHFAVRAKAVERIKTVTQQAILDADVPPLAYVHVELHWRPKTNRTRDGDNAVGTLKPAIDAMHHPAMRPSSGWVPIIPGDDARFVSWSQPVLHAPMKGTAPALWLVLRSAQPATETTVDQSVQAVLL